MSMVIYLKEGGKKGGGERERGGEEREGAKRKTSLLCSRFQRGVEEGEGEGGKKKTLSTFSKPTEERGTFFF